MKLLLKTRDLKHFLTHRLLVVDANDSVIYKWASEVHKELEKTLSITLIGLKLPGFHPHSSIYHQL